jgi:pyruvate dehydrogenase E2 component (dihydrolipoamide acetyltransferase)
MTRKVVMPRVQEAAADVTVASWNRRVGDRVEKGDVLLSVEVDKATVDIESPGSGYLRKIAASDGSVCRSGDVLGFITDTLQEPIEE